jgi:hypothetical protein
LHRFASLCIALHRFAIALLSLRIASHRFAIASDRFASHFDPFDRTWIALLSLCHRFAIASLSPCYRFAIALRRFASLCYRTWIASQRYSFAIIYESQRNRYCKALQSLRNRSAIAT